MTPEQKSVMKQFLEGGHLGLILKDVKLTLAEEMMATEPSQKEKREELYYLNRALDHIEFKLQACANYEDTETQYEY